MGEMLKIDKVTTIQSRGKFARICVELDLDKPLQPKAIVREYLLNMQYEGLHVVCFKFEHLIENCTSVVMGNVRERKSSVMDLEKV